MPSAVEDSALFIQYPVRALFAAEIVRKIFGEVEAQLPVKSIIRLIGIDYEHVLPLFLIFSRKKCCNRALSAAAFSA